MSDYYSVDAILAEEVAIPGTITSGASGIGRALDPSTDAVDLPPDAHVELPLWLASLLAKRRMMSIRQTPPPPPPWRVASPCPLVVFLGSDLLCGPLTILLPDDVTRSSFQQQFRSRRLDV